MTDGAGCWGEDKVRHMWLMILAGPTTASRDLAVTSLLRARGILEEPSRDENKTRLDGRSTHQHKRGEGLPPWESESQ